MYQFSAFGSEDSFVITVSSFQRSDRIAVQCQNMAQERFIDRHFDDPYFLLREAKYNRETDETEVLSDWIKVRREAFRFFSMSHTEIVARPTKTIIQQFLLDEDSPAPTSTPKKKRSRRAAASTTTVSSDDSDPYIPF